MFRYPVNYIAITNYYKPGIHNGLDLGWNSNYYGNEQEIYASMDGIIIELKNDYTTRDTSGSSYGNYVKIKHNNNMYTLYAHLKTGSIPYSIGDTVKKGSLIGIMGNTGRSDGNHLHFEIFEGNTKINPLNITYVYPNQIVSKNKDATEGLLYYNEPEETEDKLTKKINELTKELQEQKDKNLLQTKEINSLKEEVNETKNIKFSYNIQKTSLYKINLYEGETLIIK